MTLRLPETELVLLFLIALTHFSSLPSFLHLFFTYFGGIFKLLASTVSIFTDDLFVIGDAMNYYFLVIFCRPVMTIMKS